MFRNSSLTIRGYIGATVESYATDKNGKPFLKFSICETRKIKNRTQSHWFQVTVFGDLAMALIKKGRITKGYEVAVSGTPSAIQYTDKSGSKKISHDLIADWVVSNERLIISQKGMDAAEAARDIDDSIDDESVPF